ncbi:MAG: lmo0937 family membrane protein [Thermodesulfovibrionales bacterium]
MIQIGTFVAGEGASMIWTIFVILVILWLLGLVSGYTIGGFIHVLLVIAIVVVLIRIISGRKPF